MFMIKDRFMIVVTGRATIRVTIRVTDRVTIRVGDRVTLAHNLYGIPDCRHIINLRILRLNSDG